MKNFLLILFSVLLVWSCEETELLDETGRLEVTDFNLPELPPNHHYQAWLLVGGTYVSVGNITNDSLNNNLARFSNIERTDLAMAESFAITVENSGSPAPSDYVLLLGNFEGNTADLSPLTTASNGVTTLANNISASYTLQNASIPEGQPGNYTQNGIWFFKGSGEEAETTISFHYGELRYQAWLETVVEGATRYLNMGVISTDALRDASNVYTPFNLNIPEFAGEDFLIQPSGESFPENFFPRNVTGSKLVLTPILLNGYTSHTEPFPVFLFQSTIPSDAVNDPNLTYPLELNPNFGAKATKL